MKTPDNYILDIEGATKEEKWRKKWVWDDAPLTVIPLKVVEKTWSIRKGGGMHPPTKHAKLFVPAVLNLYNEIMDNAD